MGDWQASGEKLAGAPFDLATANGPAWVIDLVQRRIADANAAALDLWKAETVEELSACPIEATFFEELLSQFALGLQVGAVVPIRLRSPTRADIPAVDCLASPARLRDGEPGLILEAFGLDDGLVTVYDAETGAAQLRNQRSARSSRPGERRFVDRYVDRSAAARLWKAVAERGGQRSASADLAARTTEGIVTHEVRLCRLVGGGQLRIVAEEQPVAAAAGSPGRAPAAGDEGRDAPVTAGLAAATGTLLVVRTDGFAGFAAAGDAAEARLHEVMIGRLTDLVRASDSVEAGADGRYVILMRGLTDRAGVDRRVAEMRRQLAMPVDVAGVGHVPEIRVGAAVWPRQGTTRAALEEAAEAAGSNVPPARASTVRRRDGVALAGPDELRQAIEGGQIEAFFQPVVGLVDGRVAGCEALARWRRPRNRPVVAARFIASVEAAGLLLPLGDVVLRDALRQLLAWTAQGFDIGGRVAVNLGLQQLTHASIVMQVEASLRDAGLSGQSLAVEITEAAALGPGGDIVVGRLNELHDLGVEIILDDFGAGHAALALLQRLPVNRVKIDRRVVAGIHVQPSCEPIIRTITDYAHSLSLQVIAEGVETREQMHILQSCGVDAGQGNLFAPAMAAGEATAWLAAHALEAVEIGAPAMLPDVAAPSPGRLGRRQLH